MTIPYILANLSSGVQPLSDIDANFAYLLGSPAITGSPTIAGSLTVSGGPIGVAGDVNISKTSGDANVLVQTSSGGSFINLDSTNGYWGTSFKNSGTELAYIGNRGLSDGTIAFYTGSSLYERARITDTGSVYIGSTTYPAFSSTTTSGNWWYAGRIYASATNQSVAGFQRTSSDGTLIELWRQNTQVGSISVTGSAAAFNTTSDYRIKTGLQKLTKTATETLMKIPVYSLIFKNDPNQKRVIGLLAHELQEHMPEAVTGEKDAEETYDVVETDDITEDIEIKDEDGTVKTIKRIVQSNRVTGQEKRPIYQQVDYSKLVTALLAMCQEQENKILSLFSRIESLEEKK